MAGFSNETMYADNVNFSGAKSPAVTTNGQLLIGSTATPHIRVGTLSSTDASVTIVVGAGTIDLSVAGAGVGVTTLTGNSGGAISPTAGNINTLGTGSITIAGAGSTLTTQLTGLTNHNVLIGAGTATITKVAPGTAGIPLVSTGAAADPAFSTALVVGGGTGNTTFTAFSVITAGTTATGAFQNVVGVGTAGQLLTSNGAGLLPTWQSAGTGMVTTLTGNTGGAISPTAGNINTLGTGSITIAGSGSTLTTQLTGLTNHNVLLGAGTATITNIAPSATGGIPLVSKGAASDPQFDTALVVGGGTGAVSFTAYSLIAAGTTATGPLQNVSGVGTLGQVLISNGAGALPTWQTGVPTSGFTSIVIQTFSVTGVYTPTAGMKYCIVEIVGGGGGGGGAASSSAGMASAGGGGGAGGYARSVFSAATIGVNKAVTIGGFGDGGNTAPTDGGAGGTTSLGVLITATGGFGGASVASSVINTAAGGAGGTGTGDVSVIGQNGVSGFHANIPTTGSYSLSGAGGNTVFGAGGIGIYNPFNTHIDGNDGVKGGGGSGGSSNNSSSGAFGGRGGPGYMVITEYI